MSLLGPSGGASAIPVRNLETATVWYIEKLGLRKIEVEMDEPEGCQALGFSKYEGAVTLVPAGCESKEELTPRFYTSNVKKARAFLVSRAVVVGEIQQDGQGTHYFEFQDLEGNKVEVCEEP